MMNMILTKLHRFGRIRQLHTSIISQETIKPSSPTPSHLKTHNLSVIDKFMAPVHIPMIYFYKNYNNGDINILKKSLSQCLTQYYPFAGRLSPTSSPADHVNCNDEGVEFLEASIDSRLDDFIVKNAQDQDTLEQLIPHSRLGFAVNKTDTSIVEVQLNHFTCGGVALAVSIAHKVADAFTMVNFVNHWATVTRGEIPPVKLSFSSSSPSPPSSSSSSINFNPPRVMGKVKYVTKRFLFSNSKLIELKNKVNAMGTTPVNPTRVDSLTSLIFKCASSAATTKSGSSQQSNLTQPVNLRGSKFPKLGAGNMLGLMKATINVDSSGKIKLNDVITSLRKERMELLGERDMEEIVKKWANILLTVGNDRRSRTYAISSICRFPIYQVDFGWGNPIRALLRGGSGEFSYFIFMDAPSGDGIEATVKLEEEEMAIFQQDEELLAYTQETDI